MFDLVPNALFTPFQCSVCDRVWDQHRNALFSITEGSFEAIPYADSTRARILKNKAAGLPLTFNGARKLYVGNLSYICTEADLLSLFSAVGEVGEVQLITDDANRSRGFAFVSMMTEEGGEQAMALDGREYLGRKLTIKASELTERSTDTRAAKALASVSPEVIPSSDETTTPSLSPPSPPPTN